MAVLAPHVSNLVVLQGGMGFRAARRAAELLAPDQPRLIVATGRFIGDGFDDPRLDTLILAMPIAWKGTLTQYAGRLHRERAAEARNVPEPCPRLGISDPTRPGRT